MQYGILRQTPEKQQFDALLLAVDGSAARLAGEVARRLHPSNRGAVAEQLRYLANLIDAHGSTPA